MVADGYKQTELGSIPNDWIVSEFHDALDGFSSGMTPYRGNPEYYKGTINWITSGELNYNVIDDTIEKITQDAVEKTNLKILPKGTFLMAITGLEAAGTRGSCGIVGKEATTNQSCMALFSTKKITTDYLYHFYVRYGNQLAFKYCQGTKQQSYTAKIVKKLPLVYPPKIEEQKVIATALSDVDGLIALLESLIKKKENIKTATMQQLLTGKKRLDGFCGEWVEKKLEEVSKVKMGHSPSSINYNTNGVGLPLIQGNADIKDRKTIIRNYTSQITRKSYANDIIMSVRAPVGEISRATFDSCIGRGVCAITIKNEFLYHYLVFIEPRWSAISTGSTFDSVNSKEVKSLLIYLPIDDEEQTAIATILSDMDKELEALKSKLSKTKSIKTGMMQELLTGKTRLL